MDIQCAVRDFVVSNFYVSESDGLADTDSLLNAGVVDSTGVLELVSFVEQTFHVQVEDSELLPENFDSISSLSAYVAHKLSSVAAA